jgi:hypothetical protein
LLLNTTLRLAEFSGNPLFANETSIADRPTRAIVWRRTCSSRNEHL